MDQEKKLYPTGHNALFIKPSRPMPKEVAMIGAGTIGPDIGYYIKTALPNIKLYLVDVVDEPLKNAQKRLEGYAKKAVENKKMKEDKAKEVLANIVYTMDYKEIQNCDLVIENKTPILRQKDILTEEKANSPCRRLYYAIQLMYIDEGNLAKYHKLYWNLVREVVQVAPSTVALIDAINEQILSRHYYQALKLTKQLIDYEQEAIERVSGSVESV